MFCTFTNNLVLPFLPLCVCKLAPTIAWNQLVIPLVCNSGPAVHVFPKSMGSIIRPVQQSSLRARARGGGDSYSDIVNKNNPPKLVMEELHKLSIVMLMRTDDTHLDFVYAPTDCKYIWY